MATAYNPDTGETLELQDGAWVPVANPDVPPGGDLAATEPPVAQFSANPLDKNFLGVTWPGEGPVSMLDAMPPIIAAPVHGLLTSKSAIQGSAAMGALASKAAAPLIDTVSYAAGKAGELVSGSLNAAESVLKPFGLGGAVAVPRSRWETKRTLEALRERESLVTDAMKMGSKGAGAEAVPARARSGLLDATTFEERLGLPSGTLSETQRRDLDQLVDPSGQLVNETRLARDKEMTDLYTGAAGAEALAKLKQTHTAYTDTITEAAGIPRGTVADKGALSAANETTGLEIDDIMRERFPDDVLKMDPKRPVSDVIGSADTSKKTASILKKYGVIKQVDDGWEDVATLPATQLTEVRTMLKKEAEAATEAGETARSQTAQAALNRLDDMIEEGMPAEVKDQLAQLRFKYRVGKRLEKPGVIKEGQVDPGAFGKSWTHGSSKNKRMYDELAVLSDTAQEMLRVKNAGNTATRVIEDAGAGVGGSVLGKLIGR